MSAWSYTLNEKKIKKTFLTRDKFNQEFFNILN